jgi:hypothetical protein
MKDEKLNLRDLPEIYTPRIHCVVWGTGTPKVEGNEELFIMKR